MANIGPMGIGFNSGTYHIPNPGDGLVDKTGGTISGLTGVLGITGLMGITGSIGIQGLTGLAQFGATGIEGASPGITGIRGITGAQGRTGIIGVTGLFNLGFTGAIGRTGILGVTGVMGIPGVQGLQGATGLAAAAATGIQGSTGVIGITGANGLPGETGIGGETGLLGITGIIGTTGFGLFGVTGLVGITGLQGVTGVNDLSMLSLQRQLLGSTILYAVPANTLGTNGQYLEFYSTLYAATDGTPTVFNVTFGGTNIFTDTLSEASIVGFVHGIVLRLGVSSQECIVEVVYSDGDAHVQRTATTLTLSSIQNLVTNSSVGTILAQIVRKLREPS